jgi:hypothetical protein
MRQVAFAILTIPTIVYWTVVLIGAYLNRPLFETFGTPAFLQALPFLNFIVSIALVFVFPNMKEWRVAALINSIPIGLIFLLFTFFFVVGYHG